MDNNKNEIPDKYTLHEDSYYAKKYQNSSNPNNYNTRSNFSSRFSNHKKFNNSSRSSQNFHYQNNPQNRRYQNQNYKSQRSFRVTSHSDRSTSPNEALEHRLFDSEEVSKGINFSQYDNIPVEVEANFESKPIKNFNEIENIHPQLEWNIDRAGYTAPTPVQKYAFPLAVKGHDILAVAQTGSGKTAAFLLPMIQMLLETGGCSSEGYDDDNKTLAPIGLIMTPTRELASQIQKQSRKFLFRTGMRSCCVYGGISFGLQMRELRGGADILVATPGRLVDILSRGLMTLRKIRFLVLDEADRMLDMGFEDQIREILSPKYGIPVEGKRQTMMFSATFPKPIQRLARKFLGEYAYVAVGKVGGASEMVRQEVVYSEGSLKRSLLLDFFNTIGDEAVLIFVQRKVTAGNIEKFLRSNDVHAMSIHGDKTQKDREYVMKSFRQGVCKVLVATDVASRGLDIPNVGFVVNFDMTSNIDDYIHRIGRTGRIGNNGVSFTIISENENAKILTELKTLLIDSNEKVPDWMDDLIDKRSNERRSNYRGDRRNNTGYRRNFSTQYQQRGYYG